MLFRSKAIEPRVPAQHTFGGDGLQNFIRDHQEELERLNDQVMNLTTMTNEAVHRLQVGQERQRADLRMAETVNAELLRQVAALEHGRDNPIEEVFRRWRRTGSEVGVTGGKGAYNQWIHCDLIVIF